MPIPFPPLNEQEEILKRVDEMFKLIEYVEMIAFDKTNHLFILNQSILAKAFRGELVEQDPNDEPASVLLDRIRAEREAQQPVKKSQRKGTTGRKKQGT